METVFPTLFAAGILAIAIAFGWRQFWQLRRSRSAEASEEQRFLAQTARRRLVISAMLATLAVIFAAIYLTGLDARIDLKENNGARVAPEIGRLFLWSWISVLLLLLGVVIGVGIDLWHIRRHWRQSLQRIHADRRDMLDHHLPRLRAEHREAQIDPELN
ncbi:MAG: hypothetical protein ACJ8C4_16640 [Gemmataceae bacterium]